VVSLSAWSATAPRRALFVAAVERTGAALADLMLYAYPAMVVIVAWLLGREIPTRRRIGALVVASAGVVLVLLGGGSSQCDAVGVLLGLVAAPWPTRSTSWAVTSSCAISIRPHWLLWSPRVPHSRS
jgi:drug/metabolite transporter (DMT)-like permease